MMKKIIGLFLKKRVNNQIQIAIISYKILVTKL
jgi:hypothetical protein